MRHIIAFLVLLTFYVAAQAQRVSHSFRNAPLAEVLTTLSREAKDHDIVFIHNELENCRVTARFNSLTIPEAVAAVTAEQPVRVKERGRTILVQYRKRRDRTGHIYGNVRNLITREVLKGVKVTMLSADSTEVIATTVTGSQVLNEKTCWYLELPLRSNGRILRFDMDGYETTSLRVSPMTLTGKSPLIYFKPVYMQRKAREVKLNEVVVKATKVKFTYRGDTLVYNADAFQLSDGSMLDALIRQLPGAELKANGQIIVNGRVVESLLLNGEDFFKKDRRIMLDNLPSYMVQNVKVYEKQSEAARTIGMKTGDEPLVMDVHLKRQYNTGLIANAETGGGSAERWMARAFALRFTNHSRLSVYANMNNLNEDRRPGETSEWTPQKMPKGRLTKRDVGLDYLVKERDEAYKFRGSVTVGHDDGDNHSRKSAVNFLPEQNTWTRSETRTMTHDVNVSTYHNLYFHPDFRTFIEFEPHLSFSRTDSRSASVSATFNADPTLSTSDPKALLDSIRAFDEGSALRRTAVNRVLNGSLSGSRKFETSLYANCQYGFGQSGRNMLQLSANVSFDTRESETFNHYRQDFPSMSLAAADYRNRYSRQDPDRTFRYDLYAQYGFYITGNTWIIPSYQFGQTRTRKDYALYRLDRLAGFGPDDDAALGELPSEQDYAQTMDIQNSWFQDMTDTWHRFSLNFTAGHFRNDNRDYSFYFKLPLNLKHTSMDYRRAAYDRRSTRNSVLFEPYMKFTRKWHKGQRSVGLSYNMYMTPPDMVRLIDLTDDEDPLNITRGNPDLKTTTRHQFRLTASNNSRRKQRTFSALLKYQHVLNAVAMGYAYNPATGVRRYRPQNVDGNNRLDANVAFSTPIDRKKHLKVSTKTDFTRFHSVDLIGIDRTSAASYLPDVVADVSPQRSTVNTVRLKERLDVEYSLGDLSVGFNGTAGWNSSHSRREGFRTVDVRTFNYGPTLKIGMPWGLRLATDLTVYTNRGFSDPSANTTDVVWNARLSKRFMGSRLTLSLDGFDILGQLSNITHTLNSQGQTETWHNSLPRYVMAHLTWRFNKEPKKF